MAELHVNQLTRREDLAILNARQALRLTGTGRSAVMVDVVAQVDFFSAAAADAVSSQLLDLAGITAADSH
jgi:hypothetical protein